MNTKLLVVMAITGAVALFAVASGCQKNMNSETVSVSDSEEASKTVADKPDGPTKDGPLQAGALLWSQNCMRCHNFRNPQERSDREWDVIVHHMRVRANLTAKEHRLILAFLQSAN